MDAKWIINRIKNIIIQPQKAWVVIDRDKSSFNTVIKRYALPLIILSSLAEFVNVGLMQKGFFLIDGFLYAIINFASYYLGMYLTAITVSYIAPSFLAINDKDTCFKLIIYSTTPIYLISTVTNLFISLVILNIIYIYPIYLLWLGLGTLLKTPEKTKMGFIVIILIFMYGSIEVINELLTNILPVNNIIVG